MNRRGFFGSLFRNDPEQFFFGVQIVFATLESDMTGAEVRTILAEAKNVDRPRDKQRFYKQIASMLLENKPYWEYGYWDYVEDETAEGEFMDWIAELNANAATEDAEFGGAIDEVHRMSADKSYVVVTMAFLLDFAPLGRIREMLQAIPEDEYWSFGCFAELLEAVRRIDFEYCERDSVFVMPGTDEDGVSWEDLHGAGWHYLKPISL
jgi:hypothetical protein